MQTSHGAIQGYNGVATADAEHQIIVHAEAHGQGSEQSLFPESIDTLKENLEAATPKGERSIDLKKATLLADSGYHSKENLQYLSDNGLDGYIADNQFRKRDPRFSDAERYKTTKHGKKPVKKKAVQYSNTDFHFDAERKTCICPSGKPLWLNTEKALRIGKNLSLKFTGYLEHCLPCKQRNECLRNPDQKTARQVTIPVGLIEENNTLPQVMIKKIDSEEGRKIYSKRLGIIEPVFGNIRTPKGLIKFTLRGKSKVDAQWKLYCMVHNIEKIAHYGMA